MNLFLEKKNQLPTKIKQYRSFKELTFRLDLGCRAYKIGFFYKPTSESIGLKFNIFNYVYKVLLQDLKNKNINNLIKKLFYKIP